MLPHWSRDADAARRTLGLEPRRHIHHVAVDVSAIWDHIANIDADAEANGTVRGLIAIEGAAPLAAPLRAQRTAPSTLSKTMSRESPPVLTILPPCSSMAGSIEPVAESPQPFERSQVVQADQATVADHVGMNDSVSFRRSCGLSFGFDGSMSGIAGQPEERIEAGDPDYLPPGVAPARGATAEFGGGGARALRRHLFSEDACGLLLGLLRPRRDGDSR